MNFAYDRSLLEEHPEYIESNILALLTEPERLSNSESRGKMIKATGK